MSDSEVNPHPSTGGKSLSAIPPPPPSTTTTTTANTTAPQPRLPYKSWRKKYRKMHHSFTAVLDQNKQLFRDEQRLHSIAKRLREELDGLLDLCLDLNQNPALPPHMRFDVSLPTPHTAVASIPGVVKDGVTPQEANDMFLEYTEAVKVGQIPHLDLHVIREQLEAKLRVQGVLSLEELERKVNHTRVDLEAEKLPEEVLGEEPPGYLTTKQEAEYLARLDRKLGDVNAGIGGGIVEEEEEKHWADMTAREVERQMELMNPMSQHNWLKVHHKNAAAGAAAGGEGDDNESLVDVKPATAARKRNLAKQVGDRAVGRAREGASPSAASFTAGGDDEEGMEDSVSSSGRKKGKGDGDGTYRVKGGKSNSTMNGGGGSASKGKRKREGEGVGSGGKKMKVEG
ncbi:uncharacterized protein RCC_06922 [Ramularia collo-cygni]|uniref:Uncharacterized protein n=1 Tax=Ramularia collo-cygni TaxID=112498 RepID=A0A2D3UWB9_9PEZI|nr:uncharacterized protein RCC_06922 [Ramularia collo-cygni]CZT21061.1 uncharacterized protein RCC_06922 [Ramularia collo-cygni]